MPNRRYIQGRAKEYRVAKKLREEGWTVLRTAGSHGEFDLICIFKGIYPPLGQIKLIQCKSGRSKKRAIKAVVDSDIKRWEGLYSVSVEVV